MSDIPDNIKDYAGPALLIALLQSVETGVIIGQAITFWSYASAPTVWPPVHREDGPSPRPGNGGDFKSSAGFGGKGKLRVPRERTFMKAVAAYVMVLTVVQTVLNFYDVWMSMVVNWGTLPDAIEVHWMTKLQPVINTALSEPMQGFLIWRCWLLTNRNNYLLVSLITLIVASAVMSIVFTVGAFNLHPPIAVSGTIFNFGAVFTATLAIPTLLNVLLTGILFKYLVRSRKVVVSRRFRRMLQLLIAITWEAAFPPCLCAVITIITYFKSAKTSAWFLLFQSVLGQLYVISFFVTINGFLSVKNKDCGISPTTALGQSWGTVPVRSVYQEQSHARAQSKNFLGGIRRTITVETTVDPPPKRVYASRLERIPKSSQRGIAKPPHVLDIPIRIRSSSPDPDAKVDFGGDEGDKDVKSSQTRENSVSEVESGTDPEPDEGRCSV